MNHDLQLEPIRPGSHEWGDGRAHPWVILSQWVLENSEELVQRIEDAFEVADPHDPIPTVFVVDDVNVSDRESHWELLTKLTEAGAIVLEPEDNAERGVVQDDPRSFARTQIESAMQTAPAAQPTAQHPEPKPSDPDGYKEFAHAIAPLRPEELKKVITGDLPRDWEYEI
jgi:hypothetical protein